MQGLQDNGQHPADVSKQADAQEVNLVKLANALNIRNF